MITLKSDREIELIRKNGRIVANTLALMRRHAAPGVTTKELDGIAEDYIRGEGAVPSFLGYGEPPYPAAICTSVNEAVVHGVPDGRALQEGDIVGIDVGASSGGFHGDGAATLPIGRIDDETGRLLAATQAALAAGIAKALPGGRLGDVSAAIQGAAEDAGFSVVRALVGHGIGREMHEAPQIPNYGRAGRGVRLKTGMVLALEPMINIGTYEVELLDDEWTIVTADRTLSAHFEHTVAITEDGPVILTVADPEFLDQ
ncbi:MAG: type I methionyl aminopeptidase [Gemmatimonadetes bacterium]|nr:type I methionyl aminopeptidase [Gemmatimonadota bacterium]